jgi:hypothetical protein
LSIASPVAFKTLTAVASDVRTAEGNVSIPRQATHDTELSNFFILGYIFQLVHKQLSGLTVIAEKYILLEEERCIINV